MFSPRFSTLRRGSPGIIADLSRRRQLRTKLSASVGSVLWLHSVILRPGPRRSVLCKLDLLWFLPCASDCAVQCFRRGRCSALDVVIDYKDLDPADGLRLRLHYKLSLYRTCCLPTMQACATACTCVDRGSDRSARRRKWGRVRTRRATAWRVQRQGGAGHRKNGRSLDMLDEGGGPEHPSPRWSSAAVGGRTSRPSSSPASRNNGRDSQQGPA